ncbi:MAG: LON peptidase substrate-binding domain-containing protein [Alphaproteobacteria bacterium]|nr:MAG: LON peptidase substrate-binding domain-containing protein [Alphaproteobacteria bacterium]
MTTAKPAARSHPSASSQALPDSLPVFPVDGVVLLPGGRLPLNIFEPRYLAMVEDALREYRMIGMIQPMETATDILVPRLYGTGCAGRITAFSETEDGRFLITLAGQCRFHVAEELTEDRGYRRIRPSWDDFLHDMGQESPETAESVDRAALLQALRGYLKIGRVEADWEAMSQAPVERLVSSLTMVCPFSSGEKQALLEARTLEERSDLMTVLLRMATLDPHGDPPVH